MYKKFIFVFLTFTVMSLDITAQINLRFPAERSVFQRDNSNTGLIQITGTLSFDSDRVEARLSPRIVGQGTPTDWRIVDNSIDGQSFTGTIEGRGGWYRLEIRAIKNEQVVANTEIQRVGIGEVFVIAGQSNAQGEGRNPNQNGATDERVIAYDQNYLDHTTFIFSFFPEIIPVNQFSQLQRNLNIGPIGYTAWCWGELGDMLVRKLNVPVLFYNAALSGTSSTNWVNSISGADTFHKFSGSKFEKFLPYHILRKTLQNHISIYGIRAILWHQGEFDFDIDEQVYVNNLNQIIAETRKNTGERLPWVVSRVSRIFGVNYPQIINAQNRVINPLDMIFPGPATDNVQPNRPDGAHFENTSTVKGLTLLAEEWNASLSNFFFTNSIPIVPKGINEITYNCISQTNVGFRLNKTFPTHFWSTGSTSSSIQVSNGDITVLSRDPAGVYHQSSRIIVENVFPKETPIVEPVSSLTACVGKTLDLKATPSKYPVNWNTGAIGNTLTVSQPVTYFANYRSNQGCLSPRSNQIIPTFVNPPNKPTIFILGGQETVCAGENITIGVSNPNGFDLEWNNGSKESQITFTQQPNQQLTVKLFSNPDCPSPESDPAILNFIEIPETPNLIQDSPFSFIAQNEKEADKYEWFFDNKPLINYFGKNLNNLQDGLYAVRAIKNTTTPSGKLVECISGLSTIISYQKNTQLFGMAVYPNPIIDGKINFASDFEIENVNIAIYNTIGEKTIEFDLPLLRNYTLFEVDPNKYVGKYYLKLTHEGISRTFPIIFE